MIMGLDHAALAVKDLKRSVAFYTDVLGLSVTFDESAHGGPVFLGDENNSFLALEEGAEQADRAAQRLDHLAFAVDDVEVTRQALASRGVTFTGERLDDDGEGKSYYFSDPDGIRLEIYGPLSAPRDAA